MRPTYPLTCFKLDASEPDSTVEVQRSASGRARVYDLGQYTDQPITLTHSLIRIADVALIEAFYRANRGQLFNLNTDLGDHWIAAFTAKPARTHEGGPWYTVLVSLMRYDPREGGL